MRTVGGEEQVNKWHWDCWHGARSGATLREAAATEAVSGATNLAGYMYANVRACVRACACVHLPCQLRPHRQYLGGGRGDGGRLEPSSS